MGIVPVPSQTTYSAAAHSRNLAAPGPSITIVHVPPVLPTPLLLLTSKVITTDVSPWATHLGIVIPYAPYSADSVATRRAVLSNGYVTMTKENSRLSLMMTTTIETHRYSHEVIKMISHGNSFPCNRVWNRRTGGRKGEKGRPLGRRPDRHALWRGLLRARG